MSYYASKRAENLGRGQWFRAVTPSVRREDRDSLDVWKHAYDSRHSTATTLNRMHMHVPDCMEQCRRTHNEKQDLFRSHSLPNLTWMDLGPLTHERSLQQRQPSYYGHVGGPERVAVLDKRCHAPLDSTVHRPSLNLMSKGG